MGVIVQVMGICKGNVITKCLEERKKGVCMSHSGKLTASTM